MDKYYSKDGIEIKEGQIWIYDLSKTDSLNPTMDKYLITRVYQHDGRGVVDLQGITNPNFYKSRYSLAAFATNYTCWVFCYSTSSCATSFVPKYKF